MMIFSGKVFRKLGPWASGMSMVAALSAALVACGGGTTQFEPFAPTRVIAFGDETSVITSDSRKYSVNALTTADAVDCATQPIWVQTVATTYSFVFAECNPGNSLSLQALMRAKAGATVDDLALQVSAQAAATGFNSKDLVTVLAGANDVLALYAQYPKRTQDDLLADARARGERLAAQVNRLIDLGARVIVATVPDLGVSPFGTQQKAAFTDTDRAALLTNLTAALNGRMRVKIVNDGRYVGLVLADEMVQSMVKSPVSFALTDAATSVCTVALPDCNSKTLVSAGDSATWLWADATRMAYGGQARLGLLAQSRAQNNPF